MTTPRRRLLFATGAFLLSAFLLVGCASRAKRSQKKDTATPVLVAPRHVELGRILSHDATDATAVIEFAPHYRSAPFLAGTRLVSRKLDTLEPTAALIAAPYQSGRIIGAYVTSGRPDVDDEVVIAPEEP